MRILRLLFLAITVVVLLSASTPGIVSTTVPSDIARWEVAFPTTGNYIGKVIKATLFVTSQPGASLDTSQMPNVGDTLALEPKWAEYRPDIPYEIPLLPDGEVEIVSRQITQYYQGGLLVTKVEYSFMYLLPIDFSVPQDKKVLPSEPPLFLEYLQYYRYTNQLEKRHFKIYAETAEFYLTPRVSKDSWPIFEFFKLLPPKTNWPLVRLAGYGLIGLAASLPLWRSVSFVSARRRRYQPAADQIPNAQELYLSWCTNDNQAVFLEAVKLYRRGVWGHPQAALWIKTTFVLYSGVQLDHHQMESLFTQIVKEAVNEPSA